MTESDTKHRALDKDTKGRESEENGDYAG